MKKSTVFLIISILIFFVSLGLIYFFYTKVPKETQENLPVQGRVLSPIERREEMQNFLNTITPTTTEAVKAAEEKAQEMQSFLDTLNKSPKNTADSQATTSR
jgi:hypothetical protein